MEGKIKKMFFSPTGGTGKIVSTVCDDLSKNLKLDYETINLITPNARSKNYDFAKEDILIFGFPVYGGRVPQVVADLIPNAKGDQTKAIVVATYGNRDYDDALLEAKDLLEQNGFKVIAAGAFVAEHSFTDKVATKRPDEQDLNVAHTFAERIIKKLNDLEQGNSEDELHVKGNHPYKDQMPPMPMKPKTKDMCIRCGMCIVNCPMQIIDKRDAKKTGDGCIQCCACIKICPIDIKYFDDPPILKSIGKLESECTERKEPELFI